MWFHTTVILLLVSTTNGLPNYEGSLSEVYSQSWQDIVQNRFGARINQANDENSEDLHKSLQRLAAAWSKLRVVVEPHLKDVLREFPATLSKESFWLTSDNCTKQTVAFLSEYVADCMMQHGGNLTTQCLQPLLTGFIQILDASWHIPPGISQGRTVFSGDWDTCQKVNIAATGALERDPLTTQMCKMYGAVGTSEPWKLVLTLDVCAPSFCSGADLESAYYTSLGALGKLGEYLDSKYNITIVEEIVLLLEVEFHVGGGKCQPNTRHWYGVSYAAVTTMIVFACICAAATAVDVARSIVKESPQQTSIAVESNGNINSDDKIELVTTTAPPKEDSVLVKCLLAFSILSNGRKLLSTEVPKKDTLGAIHGIRLLSILWVVLGHCYFILMATQMQSVDNALHLKDYVARFSFQFVANGTFSVDTFFVLSGCLVAYLTIGQFDKLQGVSQWAKFWALFYFHRFWRLTPVYMMIIFANTGIYPILATGPTWAYEPDKSCTDNWIWNLLYVNNLVHAPKMCIGWSWYLANDMQFYWLSPFILYAFWRKEIIGWLLTLLAVAVHFATTLGLSAHYHQGPLTMNLCPTTSQNGITAQQDTAEQNAYASDTYMKPWCRIGPYAMGLALGYLLQKSKGEWKLPWHVHLGGWILGITIGTLVVFGLYPINNCSHTMSQATSSLYLASSRLLWGLAVCGLIWSCAHCNSFVNRWLSWSALRPFSRLTYTVYLLHLIVYIFYIETQRRLIHMYDVNDIWFFIGTALSTFGLAVVFSLMFEAPAMGLEKLLLPRGK